jgi:serine kinase of HPr protein (carbohydrate metabolism regulator)
LAAFNSTALKSTALRSTLVSSLVSSLAESVARESSELLRLSRGVWVTGEAGPGKSFVNRPADTRE